MNSLISLLENGLFNYIAQLVECMRNTSFSNVSPQIVMLSSSRVTTPMCIFSSIAPGTLRCTGFKFQQLTRSLWRQESAGRIANRQLLTSVCGKLHFYQCLQPHFQAPSQKKRFHKINHRLQAGNPFETCRQADHVLSASAPATS